MGIIEHEIETMNTNTNMESQLGQPLLETQYVLLPPKSLIWCLYLGHFLSRWSTRMWEFSVALYMIDIWPNSLLLTAIYGVVESASVALFGPIIGEWVAKLSYVKVLQIWTLTQNLSFAVAGGTVITLLTYSDLNSLAFASLVVITDLCGAIAVLSTLAGTILIEREWVVVISEGHPTEVLTNMNSIIRRIDLVCKLLAPVLAGFLTSFVSLKASAIFLVSWNLVSVCLQYWLLISVYKGISALSKKESRITTTKTSANDHGQTSNDNNNEIVSNLPCISSWKVYLKQDVVLPGISLALLYFTVLSFGSLMTAALESDGIPAYVISIARGISAGTGISATYAYPVLQPHISTIRTGLWSIWSQWSFLVVCVASIWVQNETSSAYVLMAGVAASRLGLWMFDLAVIQQMQDQVPEMDRCVVGGVQNSLQSTMDLMGYIMGVVVPEAEDFWKLILISFSLVTASAIIYTVHVWRVRKHLFHLEKLSNLAYKTKIMSFNLIKFVEIFYSKVSSQVEERKGLTFEKIITTVRKLMHIYIRMIFAYCRVI
ncbi:uncharacterized protein [Phyllobates terribilis]|uniref:uncharacterized protein n=1 Tax=Phyllobates terribilis TaxID=111132 RepID=UPI003CCAEFE1